MGIFVFISDTTEHGKFISSKEEQVIKAELINALHYADVTNVLINKNKNSKKPHKLKPVSINWTLYQNKYFVFLFV